MFASSTLVPIALYSAAEYYGHRGQTRATLPTGARRRGAPPSENTITENRRPQDFVELNVARELGGRRRCRVLPCMVRASPKAVYVPP
jgi:hypothetical protein